jgi:hypothetical protein
MPQLTASVLRINNFVFSHAAVAENANANVDPVSV